MIKNVLAVLALAAGSAAAADLIPLEAEPGLWETTTVTERNMPGMPTIPADKLAKLPPEQRARIEAMMSNKPTTMTRQSCRLEKDTRSFADESTRSCKQTVLSATGSKQEMKVECDFQGGKGNGTVTFEAKDGEHVSGVVMIHAEANGHPMDMKITVNSKWLGESCGDVKPSGKD